MAMLAVGNLKFAASEDRARDYLDRIRDVMMTGGGWVYFTEGAAKDTIVWVDSAIPVHVAFREPQDFSGDTVVFRV